MIITSIDTITVTSLWNLFGVYAGRYLTLTGGGMTSRESGASPVDPEPSRRHRHDPVLARLVGDAEVLPAD
eukprot:13995236-Alexandrium_andersonii.AAC.1